MRVAMRDPLLAEAPLADLFAGPVAPAPARAPSPVPAPASRDAEPDHRIGHRARLRRRFMEGGADAMPDYELLELVVCRAIPRGDVKAVAKRLLRTFGDLNRVIAAPPARLSEVAGVGPAVVEQLKIAEAVGRRMARARVMRRPVLSSWDALLDYLRTAMAHQGVEAFRVLYLDRKNVLVADEEAVRGTVDYVPVYPREIVRRALELDASALILVHNHPSGDPTPSPQDVDMTHAVRAAVEVLGLVLHDHLIVGKGREVSFRAEGLL